MKVRRRRPGIRPILALLLGAGLLPTAALTPSPVSAATPAADTRLVSVDSEGAQPVDGDSDQPHMSADGRYVVYRSTSALVDDDTNGVADVYRHDRQTGTTSRVSVGVGGAEADGPSSEPEVSADGTTVVFASEATNLVANDTNGVADIFIHHVPTGTTTRVMAAGGDEPDGASNSPAISRTGRYVAFASDAGNFVAGDTNGVRDVFRLDRDPDANGVLDDTDPELLKVSIRNPAAPPLLGPSDAPDVSANGDVSFSSWNNIEFNPPSLRATPRPWVMHAGEDSPDAVTGGPVIRPEGHSTSISDDGRVLAFVSSDEVVAGSGTGDRDVFVVVNGASNRRWISRPEVGTPDGESYDPVVSGDGSTVAFTSEATNLLGAGVDTNGRPDVYVVRADDIERASVTSAGGQAGGAGDGSGEATVSAGGQHVVMATGDALAGPDANPGRDVAARVRGTEPLSGVITVSTSGSALSQSPISGVTIDDVDVADVAPLALGAAAQTILASTPLSRIDVDATPLSRIPLSRIPLSRIGLEDSPLSRIPLSRIPLSRIGGWEEALVGTPFEGLPISSLTLDQILDYADANPDSELAAITLEDLDLRDSPLSRISLASLALLDVPLSRIPLSRIDVGGSPAELLDAWCAAISGAGHDCATLGVDEETSLVALDLAGVPLSRIPLSRIPLSRIPLSRIDLVDTPLSRIPLSRINLVDTPLSRIPLSRIPLSRIDTEASPLSRIPLSRIPLSRIDLVIDCTLVDCATATIGDAADAGAIRPEATLGDLVGTFGEGEDELLLADLLPYLPDDATFGDLLLSLIDAASYPWEELPLDALGVQHEAELQCCPTTSRFHSFAFAVDSAGVGAGELELQADLPGGMLVTALRLTLLHPDGSVEVLPETASQRAELGALADGTVVIGEITNTDGLFIGEELDLRVTLRSTEHSAAVTRPMRIRNASDTKGFPGTGEFSHIVEPDTLVFGYLSSEGFVDDFEEPYDVDYYGIPAPPAGFQTIVSVSALAADLDVGLFHAVPEGPLNGAEPSALGAPPVLAEEPPGGSGPGAVDDDAGHELTTAETAGHVPVATSTHDGFAEEEVVATATETTGSLYWLKVSARPGDSSPRPYVLRYRYVAPPTEPADCPARTLPQAGQGTQGTLPGSLPAGVDTLFVVNQDRLGDTYGATEAGATMDALTALAGRGDLGVIGAVLPVDGDAAVAAAYNAWDLAPCSVAAANGVVEAISAVVDGYLTAQPEARESLRNIVLVGADDLVPFARVPDTGYHANESSYEHDLRNADGTGNPLSAAAAARHLLTDDPYGDFDPIPWLERYLYVPDVALGRLVETPADIRAAVDQFVDSEGVLDAATALTLGYDFLDDGATAVDEGLGRRLGDDDRQLVLGETWDRDDLAGLLTPDGGDVPGIASVNAHYDHAYLLPGAANGTEFTEDDLYSTADLAAAGLERFQGRVLFTMGCHGGASVPDTYVGDDPDRLDWAQAYAGAGAIYVANTGYGYGDTAAVALSERLMALFAERLDGNVNAGEALAYAKQAYLGGLGAYTNYDEKALMEAVFYGLPMFHLAPPAAPEPPAPPAPVLAPAPGGMMSTSLSVEPDHQSVTAPDGSTYLAADGEHPQVSAGRPIVPRSTEVITHPDETAHDALVLDLESTIQSGVENTIAGPVTDHSESEPAERFDDYAFPANLTNVTTFETPDGTRQQLVTLGARVVGGAGGDQREVFDRMDVEVFYSDDPDHRAPHLQTEAELDTDADEVTIEVTASDLDEHGAEGDVVRVVVLFRTPGGAWNTVELAEGGDGTWSATAPVDAGATGVEWFAQAVDAAGNVGIDSDRGRLHKVSTVAPSFDPGGDATVTYPLPFTSRFTITDPDSTRFTATADVGTGPQVVDVRGDEAFVFLDLPLGTHEIDIEVCDDGGACRTETVEVSVEEQTDVVAPDVVGAPDRAPDSGGWYRDPVTITWTSTDPEPSSGQPTVPAPTLAAVEGASVVYESDPSCDPAGNCATGTFAVSLDRTAPSTVITSANGIHTTILRGPLKGTASDALSGVDTVQVRFTPLLGATHTRTATVSCTSGGQSCTWSVAPPLLGLFSVRARSVDVAGNAGAWSPARSILFVL